MHRSMTKMPETGQYLFNDNLLDQPTEKIKNKTKNNTIDISEYIHVDAQSKKPGKDAWIRGLLNSRTKDWSVAGQNPDVMDKQSGIWDFLLDYYFRLEMTGWDRLPDQASMLIGIHSGTWLTMDAWTLCAQWWRKFKGRRILHGTAHDALMAMPGLGTYFRNVGVIPAKRESVSEAFAAGHDVVIWPGGKWMPCAHGPNAIPSFLAAEPVLSVRQSDPVYRLCRWRRWAAMTPFLSFPSAGNWRRCFA